MALYLATIFNPREIEILYRGDLAASDNSVLKLSLLKAYAAQVVNGYVSFVNVSKHVEDMGMGERRQIQVLTHTTQLLKVFIKGDDGKELTLGGVVFDGKYPRLTLINDYYFEIEPSGHLLFLKIMTNQV